MYIQTKLLLGPKHKNISIIWCLFMYKCRIENICTFKEDTFVKYREQVFCIKIE